MVAGCTYLFGNDLADCLAVCLSVTSRFHAVPANHCSQSFIIHFGPEPFFLSLSVGDRTKDNIYLASKNGRKRTCSYQKWIPDAPEYRIAVLHSPAPLARDTQLCLLPLYMIQQKLLYDSH